MVKASSPRQNKILAALPAPDYVSLRPHLKRFRLHAGMTIHQPGENESHLYFISAGLVSRCYVTSHGAAAEFALSGNEGVIGLASVLGGDSSPTRAVVVSEGSAWGLPARIAKRDLDQDGPLGHLLLRYALALIAQTGQAAACNRHHSLEQRLCRWMLSGLDRLSSNEIEMTQELLGEMLGVRRERVSEAASSLQRQGLIRYSRGCIGVIDRRLLESHVCECYGTVKREYDRLLPGERGALRLRGHPGAYALAVIHDGNMSGRLGAGRDSRMACTVANPFSVSS